MAKVAMCMTCVPPKAIAAGDLQVEAPPHHSVKGVRHEKVVLITKDRLPGERALAFLKRAEKEWKSGT